MGRIWWGWSTQSFNMRRLRTYAKEVHVTFIPNDGAAAAAAEEEEEVIDFLFAVVDKDAVETGLGIVIVEDAMSPSCKSPSLENI